MASNLNTKLDFWIKNNLNVCFIGRHGVGKTAMVKEAFDRHELNWRYFSASTMDPWVDFVGVPREKTENKIPESFDIIRELCKVDTGLAVDWVINNWKLPAESAKTVVQHALNRNEGVTYLDIVRPQFLASGEIEALFFDEFNRSPKKIRNAVMELIQFKSINGMKFPKLRFIWAAINPEDDASTYDVEKIDPAQADRFHVSVEVPYRPNTEYFRKTFGQRMADSAISWWEELGEDEKSRVSPRRLEYALDVYVRRGDMRDVLPVSSNVSKLITALNTGPITEKLDNLMRTKDEDEARKFLENENNCTSALKYIPKSEPLMDFFLPLLPKEKLSSLMEMDDKICSHVMTKLDLEPVFHNICKQISSANLNAKMVKKLRRVLTENENLALAFQKDRLENKDAVPAQPHFNKNVKGDYLQKLLVLNNYKFDSINQRIQAYEKICKDIPLKLTDEEANLTLKLLNDIFGNTDSIAEASQRSDWSFASILNSPTFDKLIPVINHCLMQLHKSSGSSLSKILDLQKESFGGLLLKIVKAGLGGKLHKEDFK